MHRRTRRRVSRSAAASGSPVERLDGELLSVLDRGFRSVAQRAGEWLACAAGCSECCQGPFPVSRLDVLRLRSGLEELRRRDPGRARAVVRRVRDAVDRLRAGFPGDPTTGKLTGDPPALDRFFERHALLACPVLDPTTGRCELYEARPVSCRTYGPPLRFDEEQAPPCRLCFQGADTATLERCRWQPDPDGLEEALLAKLGVPPGEEWETLIAFALAPR